MLLKFWTLHVCHPACLLMFAVFAGQQQEHTITAQYGQNVTLPCKALYSANMGAVEWTRPDLKNHVYFGQDGRMQTETQDPSYENRTQLGGDNPSLILTNVSSNDAGKYACRYVRKRGITEEPICIVYLDVEGPTAEQGHREETLPVNGIVSVSVVAVALAAVAALVVRFIRRRHLVNNPVLPVVDPDALQQL